MSTTTHKKELKDRVEAKRKELEAKLHEAKANGRKQGRESSEAIQSKLNELGTLASDGWENLSEQAAEKINAWLGKDE